MNENLLFYSYISISESFKLEGVVLNFFVAILLSSAKFFHYWLQMCMSVILFAFTILPFLYSCPHTEHNNGMVLHVNPFDVSRHLMIFHAFHYLN